jgi:hypothetical protein
MDAAALAITTLAGRPATGNKAIYAETSKTLRIEELRGSENRYCKRHTRSE